MTRIVICGTAYPYRGGVAAYNERLTKQFIREGDAAVIFTFKLQYPSFLFPGKTQFNEQGEAPEGIPIIRAVNSVNPFNWLKTGLRLRRTRPDLIIQKYWLPLMAPALGVIARIARSNGHTRVITIFDNVIPHEHRPGDRILTRFYVRSINAALVMTKAVENDLRLFNKRIPCLVSPHPLFDNYGDALPVADACMKLGLDPEKRYMLFFGFIREYKGLDILLDAMALPEVRQLGVKLIVAGEFYENGQVYLDKIKDNALDDDVIMHTRFISNDEVRYYFSSASLVVQPYRSATQSGVTQIAYHFNKPMIVTGVGGLAEIVPDGRCGYVVTPDAVEIATAIADFYSTGDEDKFRQGIDEQKKLYSWDKLTDTLRLLLRMTQKR